jgi:hypothetical protein
MTIAQTSVELFNQLHDQEWSTGDLQQVRNAYGFAMTLFAGRLHPSGKPYLAHCVGAASGLASADAPIDVVIAALLHGAYRLGDFGWWRMGLRAKRQLVRRALGSAEALIYGFAQQPWRTDAIVALYDRCDALDATARTVVLLRLASELDNLRDHAPLFCSDADDRRQVLRVRGPLLIELADRLRVPQSLRDALAAAVAEVLHPEVPASLRWPKRAGYLVPPESARRRWEANVAAAVKTVARRLRHVKNAKEDS